MNFPKVSMSSALVFCLFSEGRLIAQPQNPPLNVNVQSPLPLPVVEMGVKSRIPVTLVSTFVADDNGCAANKDLVIREALPDGNLGPFPFEIPVGKELIITDLAWAVGRLGSDFRVGSLFFRLGARNKINGADTDLVEASVFIPQVSAEALSSMVVGGATNLQTGVAVSRDARICVSARQDFSSTTSFFRVFRFTVHGYLKDKP